MKKITKELWFIAWEEHEKEILMVLSISTSYEKVRKYAERNKSYLEDKDWFITKYELAEDF